MRWMLVLGLVGAAFSNAATGQDKPLPKFEFRDLYVGAPKKGGWCSTLPSQPEEKMCTDSIREIAGIKGFGSYTVYGSEGFRALRIAVSDYEAATVEGALLQRYGVPCKEFDQAVQNRMGATYKRSVKEWCFADGVARFSVPGAKLGQAEFYFSVPVQSKKPTVDF